jgi:hypothetical protein
MEEERRKKIIVMKILVATIATLVFIFWIFNFQNVWQANKLKVSKVDTAQWDELKKEIGSSLGDMEKRLNTIEEKTKLAAEADGLLEGVVKRAEEIASSTASSTDLLATSSAEVISSLTLPLPPLNSEPKNNCPLYINCMPSIGEAKPCQIPPGCEEITQIAY